ncbi:MAG TPA: terminase family protein, partial [Candidatus Paceibacterota bacterium]
MILRLPHPDGGWLKVDTEKLTPVEEKYLRLYEAQVERNPLWGFKPFGTSRRQVTPWPHPTFEEIEEDPNGAQMGFLSHGPSGDGIDIKMGTAGNQAGKTTIGIVDDLIQLCDRDALPPWLQQYKFWEPPFRLRVVTMDLNNHLFGVFIPKLQELCPTSQLKGGSWDEAFSKTRRILEFKNGSYIQFLSAEQSREVHQGWTGDRIHFDEEPPPPNGYDIYQESRKRVMASCGQLMFTMTPLLGLSWSYDELWQRKTDSKESIFGIQWSLVDNSAIPESAIKQEIVACRTEREFKARIMGDFTSYRGRVLEQFEDRHIVEPPSRQKVQELDVIVGIDPGLSRCGVVWCGFDKDNAMVVFDELYLSNIPLVSPDPKVDTVVSLIREKNKRWGKKPLYYVVDPAARIRDMVTAHESVQTALIREGFLVIPGENAREPGILEMWGRLEASPPALVVSKACTNWLHEQDRWLVHQDEVGAEARPSSGKGVNFTTTGPDHLMDPTRYCAMARAWGV